MGAGSEGKSKAGMDEWIEKGRQEAMREAGELRCVGETRI